LKQFGLQLRNRQAASDLQFIQPYGVLTEVLSHCGFWRQVE
jgi:hypothetical protein